MLNKTIKKYMRLAENFAEVRHRRLNDRKMMSHHLKLNGSKFLSLYAFDNQTPVFTISRFYR